MKKIYSRHKEWQMIRKREKPNWLMGLGWSEQEAEWEKMISGSKARDREGTLISKDVV